MGITKEEKIDRCQRRFLILQNNPQLFYKNNNHGKNSTSQKKTERLNILDKYSDIFYKQSN